MSRCMQTPSLFFSNEARRIKASVLSTRAELLPYVRRARSTLQSAQPVRQVRLSDLINQCYRQVFQDRISVATRGSEPGVGFILGHPDSMRSIAKESKPLLEEIIARCLLLCSDCPEELRAPLEAAQAWFAAYDFSAAAAAIHSVHGKPYKFEVNYDSSFIDVFNHAAAVLRSALTLCNMPTTPVLELTRLEYVSFLRPKSTTSDAKADSTSEPRPALVSSLPAE